MRIKSIRLRNYRKFRNVELEFGDGIIGITGLNGAGKSTLVEAIAWALYGNDRRITRNSKESVKSSGALPSDTCGVYLNFEMDGNDYFLMREMRGKNGTIVAEITENGKKQASTDGAVKEYIEKKLGLDVHGFMTSVFARQKELNELSNMRGEERKKLIERMLGLDAIDRARKLVREDVRAISSEIGGLGEGLYDESGRDMLSVKRDALEERKMEMDGVRAGLEEAEGEMEELKKKMEVQKNALEEIREKYEKYMDLKSRMKALHDALLTEEKMLEKREKELEEIGNLKKERDRLHTAVRELSEKEKVMEKIREEKERYDRLKGLKTNLKRVEERMKRHLEDVEKYENRKESIVIADVEALEMEKKALEKTVEKLDRKCNELESERFSTSREIKALKRDLEDIKELGPDSKCPKCHRRLGDHYEKLIEEIRAGIEEKEEEIRKIEEVKSALKEEIKEHRKRIEDMSRAIEEEKEKIREMKSLDRIIEEKRKELERARMEMEEIKREIENIGEISFDEKEYGRFKTEIRELKRKNEEYIRLNERISREESIKREIGSLRSEMESRKKELSEIRARLYSLDFSEDTMKIEEERLNKMKEREKELIKAISELRERIKGIERDMGRIENEIEDIKRRMKRLEERIEERRYLQELDKLLKEFRTGAISTIRPNLEEIASELFNRMTDGKYPGIEIDEDYNIKIMEAGGSYPLERFSGGESDLANLCLRLAISEVVVAAKGAPGFNFLVLDEIFGSQDVTRRENILKALQTLSNRFSQIFLITHIEEIKDYTSMLIGIRENENGESKVEIL